MTDQPRNLQNPPVGIQSFQELREGDYLYVDSHCVEIGHERKISTDDGGRR